MISNDRDSESIQSEVFPRILRSSEAYPAGTARPLWIVMYGCTPIPRIHPEPDAHAYYDPQKDLFIQHIKKILGSLKVRIIASFSAIVRQNDQTYPQIDNVWLPSISRAFYRINAAAKFALKALQDRPRVVYIFHDGVGYVFLPMVLILKIRGASIFVDYRNPPDFEGFSRWPWFIRLPLLVCELALAKFASRRIAVSEACATYVENTLGPPRPTVVISAANPVFAQVPTPTLTDTDSIKFCYWGSLSAGREVEEVVNGFVRARVSSGRDLQLFLVGSHSGMGRLTELLSEKATEAVKLLPPMSQPNLAEFLKRVDVAVVPIPKSNMRYRLSYPLKLAEAFAAGKPILASRIPATKIVERLGVGFLCEHRSADYARAFLQFDAKFVRKCVRNLKNLDPGLRLHGPETVFAPIINQMRAVCSEGGYVKNELCKEAGIGLR